MFTLTLAYGLFLLLSIITFRWIMKYFAMRKIMSAIPGPKSIPFIGLTWEFMHVAAEDRFQWFTKLIAKYPNGIFSFWIGTKPLVFIYKPKLSELILSSNTLITKSAGYNVIKPWLGNGLITSTGDLWFKRRKMLTPAFHFNVLENYAASMQDNVKIFIECIDTELRKNPKSPINIFEFAVRYTLDTICETAMGVNIDCQRKGEVEYAKAVHKYSKLSSNRVFKFWLKWDAFFIRTADGKECQKALQTMHNFTEKVILQKQLERKINASKKVEETTSDVNEFGKRKKKAFLDLLLDESEKAENPLTFVELRQEVDTFMFAGHDTTAATISWSLFALGNESKIQDKVYEEIIEVFGVDNNEVATTKQLGQLKYLDRVIKEVMRIFPTIPLISRYVDRDTVLGGYMLPKGTTLSISTYMLHRNPEIWEDPEKFDPDRFLPENIHSKSPYAHVPFSAGPRNCIGQKFAYLEMKIALTAILRRWQVSSVKKTSEMKLVANLILRAHDDKIDLYFKPR